MWKESKYLQRVYESVIFSRGLRRSQTITTLDKVTIMPPSVKGCRVVNESASKIAPEWWSEGDIGILRDDDGKSDGGGKDDDGTSDGNGVGDDGKSDGNGIRISFPGQRTKVGLVGRSRLSG
uniref:Uncharacterized protein n=1 Tax=Tanacetum cinerariifolium TaxID=118510 RepID=A0A699I2G4_TANCI|nr:hypothetical protein [Tanacetum cinerariifolium]